MSSNYPHGLTSFGRPVLDGNVFHGTHYYVHSGTGSASNDGKSKSSPFASMSSISDLSANYGDVVFVMPGHAESLTTAIEFSNSDGLSIIGLGVGLNRPTFTCSATTNSRLSLTSSGQRLANVNFVPAAAGIDRGLNATGANCVVEGVTFLIGASPATEYFTQCIRSGGSSSGLVLQDCRFYGDEALGSAAYAFIFSGNDAQDITVRRCFVNGLYSITAVRMQKTAQISFCLSQNIIRNSGAGSVASAFNAETDATGHFVNNYFSGEDALVGNLALGNIRTTNNYVADADDVNGIPVPTTPAS